MRNQDHHLLVFDGGIAKFRSQYQGRSVEVLDLSLWSRLPLKKFFQANISERFLHGRGGPLEEVQHEQFRDHVPSSEDPRRSGDDTILPVDGLQPGFDHDARGTFLRDWSLEPLLLLYHETETAAVQHLEV